jgi:NitT/TauT family transport system ATP-binding protein
VQEIRFDPRFLELHHQIWDSLREEVQRAYERTAQAPTNDGGSP